MPGINKSSMICGGGVRRLLLRDADDDRQSAEWRRRYGVTVKEPQVALGRVTPAPCEARDR